MLQLRGTKLKRFIRKIPKHNKDIVIIAENIQYGMNVGSIFRISDAVGVKKLYLAGISKTPSHKTVREVGRSKHKVVDWEYIKETESIVKELKDEGYRIVALEITDESFPYYDFVNKDAKIAVVVGSEMYGITKKTLGLCDSSVYIPMYGKGKSLNVHVSLAVFLYSLLS